MNITDYPIDSQHYRSTTTQDERIRFLILHYTAENFSQSMTNLASDAATVSVHYVIPDPDEVTYLQAGFSGNRIFAHGTQASANGKAVPTSTIRRSA